MAQDGPEMAQDAPKMAQDSLKMARSAEMSVSPRRGHHFKPPNFKNERLASTGHQPLIHVCINVSPRRDAHFSKVVVSPRRDAHFFLNDLFLGPPRAPKAPSGLPS